MTATRDPFGAAARGRPAFIGVIHLPPLPGAPRPGPPFARVLADAARDAAILLAEGADAVIVENLGDAPFCRGPVPPETVAALTLAAQAVADAAPTLHLGLNVLRNDGRAALGIAAVVAARFVRINVLTGAAVTDQGLIEGDARAIATARRLLTPPAEAGPAVAADVHVKHARPLAGGTLADDARDTWLRAGADALVISGTHTGGPTDPADLARVRDACPDAPLWVGSGVTPQSAPTLRDSADAAIVGTWLHADGALDAPLDPRRVRDIARALSGPREH